MMHRFSLSRSAGLRRQRGISLLEIIVSLTLFAIMFSGMAAMSDRFAKDTRDNVVAEHLRRVAEAGRSYVRDNYSTIAASAGPTTPFYISVANLVAGGYLQSGFSATNAYNQSVCILVLQPSANRLQALVVSEGGNAIDDISLGTIVAQAGGSAGAMRSGTSTITGTQGGWSIARSSYHNLPNTAGRRCDGSGGNVQIADGRLAYAIWFDPAATTLMSQWKDPVANVGMLPATGNVNGDTRLVIDINRSYTWNSGAWYANGLTNEGFMRGPDGTTIVADGQSCTGKPIGSIARDALGRLYVCSE